MTITFKESEEAPFHKDLHIYIPELQVDLHADTYFFALDTGILPEEETEDKVKIVLRNLLNYWEQAVENVQERAVTFLPFDFSDEYLGALKVQRNGNNLIIQNSWSREYFSGYPSFTNNINFRDEQFNIDIDSMVVPIEQFLYEIRRERDKIH